VNFSQKNEIMKEYLRLFLTEMSILILTLRCKSLSKETYNRVFKSKILIVSPHPDDEIIGLGGLILEALNNKCDIYLVFLTDGESSGAHGDKEVIKKIRLKLTENICNRLDIPLINVHHLHFTDGAVPHLNHDGYVEAVVRLKEIIEKTNTNVVFATHPLDYWPCDHVACASITKEAVKQSNLKVDLYFYWVWAWYHLKPWQIMKLNFKNYFKIRITQHLAQKKVFIDAYIEPLSTDGKPWSGILPKSLLKGNKQEFEVIEKIEY
jgi:LmbE family N-acetylglucosaminyl deacetylase